MDDRGNMQHTYRSYGKINIYLAVLGKRTDNFHELDTVLQTIDLADTLTFEPLPDNRLDVVARGDGVPSGPDNLVWKALSLLKDRFGIEQGMAVHITKRIPAQAGLGGGSSNAACALCVANDLWQLGLKPETLEQLGAEIGSDVPFFIRGGTQRCRGRGELLTPVPALPESHWVVVKPGCNLPTALVFNRVRSILTPRTVAIKIILALLAKRNLPEIAKYGFNDLEDPAKDLQPRLAELWQWMHEMGLTDIRLAGSGSACIGYCPEIDVAKRIQEGCPQSDWSVFIVKPVGRGWAEG
jgi:4-diphosphocytidyl-2-C-methyl-D-erythritol kinase